MCRLFETDSIPVITEFNNGFRVKLDNFILSHF